MPANQRLTDLLRKKKTRYCSMELSPHKPIQFEVVEKMKINFFSIIWMGSYEDTKPEEMDSLILAKELISRGYTVILHVTARNNNKKSLAKVLDYAKSIGVRNLLALRGGSKECKQEESAYEFPHTPELVKYITTIYKDYFDICVAGFPYKHPDSESLEDDILFLKKKCNAGAKFIITQAGFSYDVYKRFLINIRKNKITLPVIPGVYVIQSAVDFCLLKKLFKVPPDDPAVEFVKENLENEKEVSEYGMRLSTEIVNQLLQDMNFLPPHIFSMNEFKAIDGFLDNLTYGTG